LALSALAEAHPLAVTPRPFAWGLVFLGSLALSILACRAAGRPSRRRGLLGLALPVIFLGSYYAILLPLGWSHWVLFHLGWRGEELASVLFLLLPGAALALWLSPSFYRMQRRALPRLSPRPSFLDWLGASARVVLLVGSVFLFCVWATLCLEALPWLGEALEIYPSLDIALTLAGILVAFTFYPFVFLLARRTRAIPPGPLLDSLTQVSRGLSLSPKRIRIWEGTPLSVNACALGLLPRTRHVLFTSGMCEHLEPGEVTAVFSHEAGHLTQGHIGLYFLLLAAFFLSMGPLQQASQGLPPWLQGCFLASWIIVYWGIFFGHLARWLEVEADLFGARVVGFPVFAATLANVAALLGSSSARGGWRHFSLKRRLEILSEAWDDPRAKERLVKRGRFLRRAVYLFLALGLVGFAWSARRELGRPEAELALASAQSATVQAEELRPLLFERSEGSAADPLLARIVRWLSRSRETIATSYRAYLVRAEGRLEEALADRGASSLLRSDSQKLLDAVRERRKELGSLKTP
jgi:Zn-dependent protease with chaperone function